MSDISDAPPRPIGTGNSLHLGQVRTGNITQCGITLNLKVYSARCGARSLELTAREFDLLRMLVEENDRVVPRREIHAMVWSNGESNARVVDTYVSRLRRKLTDAGHPGIRAVHMRGYRLISPDDST
ncbi:MAG: winged helix-turn-helix domain-containing protein [Phycisphaerales bacterium]|nr:winged helix-turn-helix domain-containing protein [Phycisphaerales bacterium]